MTITTHTPPRKLGRRTAPMPRSVPAIVGPKRLVLVAVATGGLMFQAFHFGEHGSQLAHWIGDRSAAPWMSAWAMAGTRGLADLFGTTPAVGMELLHLFGNLLFLAGLLASLAFVGRAGRARADFLRARTWQGLHVAEHVALTATAVVVGRPLGLSTGFGLWDASQELGVAVRVCTHFMLNLVPSVLAARAAVAWWVARRAGGQLSSQPQAVGDRG